MGWSVRLRDLLCLVFYLWGHMQTLVYDIIFDNARSWVQESQYLPEKFQMCPEYSRMFGFLCTGGVRCALKQVEETSNIALTHVPFAILHELLK